MIEEGIHPADGKPWVQPSDRASWRAWLIANHATSSGVHLVTWRRAAGQPTVDYGAAVEEALCVGWVDSKAGKLDAERMTLWFTARRPRSGWSRPNKERVERLIAAGQMLPAGLAVIEEAKQRGTWTLLDDVEDLVVPPDLAAAFAANPPAGAMGGVQPQREARHPGVDRPGQEAGDASEADRRDRDGPPATSGPTSGCRPTSGRRAEPG